MPTGLFINNAFVAASSGSTVDVYNPSNDEKIATIAAADEDDVNAAVKAAASAWTSGWRDTTAGTRAKLLLKLATLVERDAAELATLEAVDAGVLYGDSQNLNIPQALETLRYFARLAEQAEGQMLDIPGGYAQVSRQPYGVCAAIVPWNAPL